MESIRSAGGCPRVGSLGVDPTTSRQQADVEGSFMWQLNADLYGPRVKKRPRGSGSPRVSHWRAACFTSRATGVQDVLLDGELRDPSWRACGLVRFQLFERIRHFFVGPRGRITVANPYSTKDRKGTKVGLARHPHDPRMGPIAAKSCGQKLAGTDHDHVCARTDEHLVGHRCSCGLEWETYDDLRNYWIRVARGQIRGGRR